MFTKSQSKIGGQKTQAARKAAQNFARSQELKKMAESHGGYAALTYCEEDTLKITSGVLEGKVFFTDTKPEAIFNDGTFVGDEPWFLED
jgi:hypothetical protein